MSTKEKDKQWGKTGGIGNVKKWFCGYCGRSVRISCSTHRGAPAGISDTYVAFCLPHYCSHCEKMGKLKGKMSYNEKTGKKL